MLGRLRTRTRHVARLLTRRNRIEGPEVPLLGSVHSGDAPPGFTYPQFREMRAAGVADLAGYSAGAFPLPLTLTIAGEQLPGVSGQLVSGNYFTVLGVSAAAGRLLTPDDDRTPGQHPVAVISHALWRERFGARSSAVGQAITLGEVTFTIVGVTRKPFLGMDVGRAPDVYVPMMMQDAVMPVVGDLLVRPTVNRTWIQVIARLPPGTSPRLLEAALFSPYREGTTVPRPPGRGPVTTAQARITVTAAPHGLSALRGQFAPALRVLMGLVVLVLLLACANVANLLLARSDARRTEFAVRLALGAGRWRLARQLLLESALLAALGALAGLSVARVATAAIIATLRVNDMAVTLDVALNARILLFTIAVSSLTALAFGLAPLRAASRTDFVAALSRVTGRREGRRFALVRVLTMAQVAFSLMLIAGAALFARSLQSLYGVDADIDRDHILLARVEPRGSNQRTRPGVAERLDRAYVALRNEVAALPGVASVSLSNVSPTKPESGASVLVPSHPEARLRATAQIAYPNLFSTLGLPLLAGREFTDADTSGSAPVCIVNRAFVRLAYPAQNPLGEICSAGGGIPSRIVGVVNDVRFTNLRSAAPPTVYTPYMQANTGRGQMILFVKTTVPGRSLVRSVAHLIRQVDLTVPQYPVRTLGEELASVLARERLLAGLSGGFGVIALVMASVGLFGLLSFTSSTRMAEFALRMVFGAAPRQVALLVLKEAGGLIAAGVAAGAVLAALAMRAGAAVLSILTVGTPPVDPLAIAGAALVLVVSGGLAAYLPASRAARLPPMTTLRTEQQ